MNCRRFKNQIVDVARGFQKPTSDLQAHLAICSACAAGLEDQRSLSTQLKMLHQSEHSIQASAQVEQNVLRHFRMMVEANAEPRFQIWQAAAAAALLLVSIGGGLLLQYKNPATPRMVEEPAQTQKATVTEISSGFIPLIHGELSGDSVQLVRVKLPRSSLMEFGLPVNMEGPDEMIDAEVIVGEEGLPHAIRFIQQSNSMNDAQEEE